MNRIGPHTGASAGENGLPRLMTELVASTEALSAVSAALWLHGSGQRAAPAVERTLGEVLAAVGLADLRALEREDVAQLAQTIRARVREASELGLDPLREPGRASAHLEVICAASLGSELLAPLLRDAVVPRLLGLAERLSAPRAAFLEVGVGAGGLVIALCRLLPHLTATGIDVHEPALALGRQRARAAGLAARALLRRQDVADLADRDRYDLAWLPTSFIGPEILPGAARRVLAATRPGGWVILSGHGGVDELSIALARLRTARQGGTLLTRLSAESLLATIGCESVQALPRHPMPALEMTAGRRPCVGARAA
ncbi:MAG TPA: class I SAM-dependent methyltransferase [Solirubrobacteraceae bacterium]|jgi:precorrin-6B methylase 2|nr:class I SAM-dependent methyltransferase [Solirubrobacteraceae bacterium]